MRCAHRGWVVRNMIQEKVDKPGSSTIHRFNTDAIPRVNITQQDLLNTETDAKNWLTYGGGYRNQRFSTADIITKDNVTNLSLEWKKQLGEVNDNFQGTPLLVPGDPPIIYQTNGPDQTRSLNARTGEILWEHIYQPRADITAPPASRGVAVLGDTLYRATLDLGVLAMDRYTASEKWYFNGAKKYRNEEAKGNYHEELLFDRGLGYVSSYPLIIYKDTIIHGSFGGEYGVAGWASGLSLSGEKKWETLMVPPDQWVGDSWKHGGGTVWQAPAIDPETDTVVFGTSNPGPWYGTVRPGWNRYTAGKVGLDATTGEVKWDFQESPHDWWDYDSPSPPVIYDAEVNGKQRTLVSWAGKTGWVFTVDIDSEATAKLVERTEEFVQHHNMWALPKQKMENTPWIMPNFDGGTDPQPPAFDRNENVFVVSGTNVPMKLAWNSIEYQAGKLYVGMDWTFWSKGGPQIEGWNNQHGVVAGIDPVSGDVLWQDWRRLAQWGRGVATTTGITFFGTAEGKFIAYDTKNGDKLWTHNLGVGIDGCPITWIDPKTGKQYVAVQAGGSADVHPGGPAGNLFAVFSLKG